MQRTTNIYLSLGVKKLRIIAFCNDIKVMLSTNEAGLANHWPVFGGVSQRREVKHYNKLIPCYIIYICIFSNDIVYMYYKMISSVFRV